MIPLIFKRVFRYRKVVYLHESCLLDINDKLWYPDSQKWYDLLKNTQEIEIKSNYVDLTIGVIKRCKNGFIYENTLQNMFFEIERDYFNIFLIMYLEKFYPYIPKSLLKNKFRGDIRTFSGLFHVCHSNLSVEIFKKILNDFKHINKSVEFVFEYQKKSYIEADFKLKELEPEHHGITDKIFFTIISSDILDFDSCFRLNGFLNLFSVFQEHDAAFFMFHYVKNKENMYLNDSKPIIKWQPE